jgi:hypothetical protein
MPVRLGRGIFVLADGEAIDTFEAWPLGAITTIPTVTGNAGCVLGEGIFLPRI